MILECEGFRMDDSVPIPFTCDGAGISPEMRWREEPANTKAFAVIVDDPDAPKGTFTHWLLYNLPHDVHYLPGHALPAETFQRGMQGRNDFGQIGYGAPCPPGGKPHRYRFTIFALDAPLPLPPQATRQQIQQSMQQHVIDQGEVVGHYQRQTPMRY